MAAKTMILRPTSSPMQGVASGSIATYNPPGTAHEEAYKLVNETVADDDATYINLTNGKYVHLGIDILSVANYSKWTAVRLVLRLEATNSALALDIYILGANESSGSDVPHIIGSIGSANLKPSWTDTTVQPSIGINEIQSYIAQRIKLGLSDPFIFRFYSNGSAGGKGSASGDIKITQLYLEVDYDDGETTTFYLKQSGVWEAVSGEIYNKVNGEWVSGDLSSLEETEKVSVEILS